MFLCPTGGDRGDFWRCFVVAWRDGGWEDDVGRRIEGVAESRVIGTVLMSE
jgi:hypothetical protein